MGHRRIAVAALALTSSALGADLVIPAGLDTFIPAPDDNPLRADVAALGKRLFFDKLLSRDRTISCATCHDPKRAFTDDRPLAAGIGSQKGTRRTPSIINRAWGKSFFWDGRAATLEDQVLKPITNPIEMDLSIAEALDRLRTSGAYPALSEAAMARALATYVRTILAGDSPFDRYVRGDRSALTPGQIAGLRLFRGKANCTSCHLGPNLTDERFHNTGLKGSDEGRFAVTRLPEDRGAFKTPTLREIATRAPYMHDGSLKTLEDVVEHYDKGGEPVPNRDAEMRKLDLTAPEKKSLVEFLRALSGTVRDGM